MEMYWKLSECVVSLKLLLFILCDKNVFFYKEKLCSIENSFTQNFVCSLQINYKHQQAMEHMSPQLQRVITSQPALKNSMELLQVLKLSHLQLAMDDWGQCGF